MFGASCQAAGSIDDEPDNRKEFLALRVEAGQVIAPDEKVRFVCFQYMGDVPKKEDLPQGSSALNRERSPSLATELTARPAQSATAGP
jgi:hypothetical protein